MAEMGEFLGLLQWVEGTRGASSSGARKVGNVPDFKSSRGFARVMPGDLIAAQGRGRSSQSETRTA
ncbi:hypothetical protein ACYOEI_19170 [Singulisphaera rosea]